MTPEEGGPPTPRAAHHPPCAPDHPADRQHAPVAGMYLRRQTHQRDPAWRGAITGAVPYKAYDRLRDELPSAELTDVSGGGAR